MTYIYLIHIAYLTYFANEFGRDNLCGINKTNSYDWYLFTYQTTEHLILFKKQRPIGYLLYVSNWNLLYK